jgi:hypothetical protein
MFRQFNFVHFKSEKEHHAVYEVIVYFRGKVMEKRFITYMTRIPLEIEPVTTDVTLIYNTLLKFF